METKEVTIEVVPNLDHDSRTLELVSRFTMEGISEQISNTVVELEEKMIYEALIELGWTPPEEKDD